MIGRAQLACDIDERWNGPPPRCERKYIIGCDQTLNELFFLISAIQCEPPREIENGKYESSTNETTFGSVIQYTCKFGYRLIGPKSINCLANGQYDALPPKCQGTSKND
jgi:hypothetical protein